MVKFEEVMLRNKLEESQKEANDYKLRYENVREQVIDLDKKNAKQRERIASLEASVKELSSSNCQFKSFANTFEYNYEHMKEIATNLQNNDKNIGKLIDIINQLLPRVLKDNEDREEPEETEIECDDDEEEDYD